MAFELHMAALMTLFFMLASLQHPLADTGRARFRSDAVRGSRLAHMLRTSGGGVAPCHRLVAGAGGHALLACDDDGWSG